MNPKRIEDIKPFIVMDVLERAISLERQGRSIIHLEIGEPDFPTPKGIIEAGIEALRRGETHYTDSRGIIELRTAVASYYKRIYGVSVSEEQVLITMGTSPALLRDKEFPSIAGPTACKPERPDARRRRSPFLGRGQLFGDRTHDGETIPQVELPRRPW